MSIKAMVWAWEQDVTSTEVLVLLSLADHANESGMCWPSQKYLALKTKLGRQAINAVIGRLRDKGMLEIMGRKDSVGRPLANVYQLRIEGIVAQNDRGYVALNDSTVAEGDINLQYESSKREPSSSGTGGPTPTDDDSLEPEALMETWNEFLVPLGFSKVAEITPTRRMKAKLRLKEHPDEIFWRQVFSNINGSKFLRGMCAPRKPGERPFKADFDWLVDNDTNVVKVYEGKYLQ